MNDGQLMRRAIRLARRGEGYVEPNPMVGCVIARSGKVIAEGWHRRFGQDHAEVVALKAAGGRSRGADVYVTLEPCVHFGKTPPCVDALVAAGVGRVVIGSKDPNAQAAGGAAKLRRAGIKVDWLDPAGEAKELIRPFHWRVTTGLPYVIAKWAATLDGAIASQNGESRWISNEESRHVVHELRAKVDGVMVGIGTVLADDPQLTARGVRVRRVARRIVIDPQLRIPLTSRVLESIKAGPVTIGVSEARLARGGAKVRQLRDRGVELVGLAEARGTGGLAIGALLKHLSDAHQATRVLVEGGSITTGRLVELGLVNEIWAFVAPSLLVDGTGMGAMRLATGRGGGRKMSDVKRLELKSVRRIGSDVLLRYGVVS